MGKGKSYEVDKDGVPHRVVGVHIDINRRKRTEIEKEKLIERLKRSLDEIKQLQELVPICSHCKRIRDDNGYWQQVDKYISDNSHIKFTHGLCPDCLEKYYEELLNDDENVDRKIEDEIIDGDLEEISEED